MSGHRSLFSFFGRLLGSFRRLGLRALVLTILAIALINALILIVISRASPNFDSSLAGPPVVRQAAAAAKLMDGLTPDARLVAITALNSPMLRLSLTEDFKDTPTVENPTPVFVPIIAVYSAILGERQFSVYKRNETEFWLWRSARLADELIIVMRLSDGSGLVVESGRVFQRQIALFGVALMVAFVSLVLIGFMTWASLSYERPLSRLANASRNLLDQFDSSSKFMPLPEEGPKPVRALANALNQTSGRLFHLIGERTTTLAAVAHDLRTYLTRLRMRSEFIENEDQREKTIRDIEDMASLVEDTLLLGKGVTKPPIFENVDLKKWLNDFVSRRAEVKQDVVLGDISAPVDVDIAAPELTRALNNLVDNALRYAGMATLHLKQVSDQTAAIEVMDEGCGVPEAFLEQMIEPFTRLETSRSRDTGGTGLGLAIAKAIIEQVGGTLTLANREEGGFCARIELPILQPAANISKN